MHNDSSDQGQSQPTVFLSGICMGLHEPGGTYLQRRICIMSVADDNTHSKHISLSCNNCIVVHDMQYCFMLVKKVNVPQ